MSTIRSLITGMLPIGSTDDRAVAGESSTRLVEVGVAGQAGLAVDLARRTSRRSRRGTSSGCRSCRPGGLGLEDRLEHRAVRARGRPCTPASTAPRPTPGQVAADASACSRACAAARPSVLPLLGLPLGDRHRRVGDLGRRRRWRDVMCLSHSSSLRSGKSVRNCAPRDSLRSIAPTTMRLGAVEHVAQLDRAQHVLVEDRAAVVDPGGLRLLLEALDDLEARAAGPPRRGTRRQYSFIASPSSSLISETRRPPCSRAMIASIQRLLVGAARASGRPRASPCRRARSAACSPERRPKISVSSSEFAPRRLPPWTETHATSPAA